MTHPQRARRPSPPPLPRPRPTPPVVPLAVARAWVEGWHLAGEHAFEASDGGPIRRAWRRQLALFEAAVRADERQRLIASDMATADHGRNER